MRDVPRSRVQDLYGLADRVHSYDEWPLVPEEVDPQVSISHNDVRQPFFLILDHDTCVAQLKGTARIEFSEGPIRQLPLEPADWVYVPAGIGHRIKPYTPSLQLRFSAREAHIERAVFKCDCCQSDLSSTTWNSGSTLRQEGFLAAALRAERFVQHPCPHCGASVTRDESSYRWREVAELLRHGPASTDPSSEVKVDKIQDFGDRYPWKANALWAGHLMNSQSAPLFSELGPGAMVPCVAMVFGREDPFTGCFFHQNTVDEVVLWQATSGDPLQAGMLRVGDRNHPVQNRLPDPRDPDQFVVSVIVQRQTPEGPQREQVTFRCHVCDAPLISNLVEFVPPTTAPIPSFDTITLAARTAREFNADGEKRQCNSCGTVNPSFDLGHWGWDQYAARLRVANKAALSLQE
jgi:hypothetical protein